MTLVELKVFWQKVALRLLEIHAFEGIIYLVKVITEVGGTFVKTADGDNRV